MKSEWASIILTPFRGWQACGVCGCASKRRVRAAIEWAGGRVEKRLLCPLCIAGLLIATASDRRETEEV